MPRFHPTPIGRVFTPRDWAKWSIQRFNIYESWRRGASIIDPACGTGSFFLALFEIAKERAQTPSQTDLLRLLGVERNTADKARFLQMAESEFGIAFPEANFVVGDFLEYSGSQDFDIAMGNPPWVNFADLPPEYKEFAKRLFTVYGLVKSKKDLLLGSSRCDLSALFLNKVMSDHVRSGGNGYFFIPLSLFFNENANQHLRPKAGEAGIFSVEAIIDFEKGMIFKGIATRSGFVHISSGRAQSFPIPMQKFYKNAPVENFYCHCIRDSSLRTSPSSSPSSSPTGSADTVVWVQSKNPDAPPPLPKIAVARGQVPRQGMNSSGLNKVLHLLCKDDPATMLPASAGFINGYGEEIELETDFVYPLMHKGLFAHQATAGTSASIETGIEIGAETAIEIGADISKKAEDSSIDTADSSHPQVKQKYILCLYEHSGRPVSAERIRDFPLLCEYISKYKEELSSRKGVLIRSQIARGRYWSLLGVGQYSFTRYKIAWEALGRSRFRAVVLDGRWQGNQSLHAFIPASDYADATRICRELNAKVPAYLKSFAMEGTCNWAQPGRIRRLLVEDGA